MILNRTSILRASPPGDVRAYAQSLGITPSVFGEAGLPEGFPIPMDRNTREINEVMFAHLLDRYLLSSTSSEREHTENMSADDHANVSIETKSRNRRIKSAYAAARDLSDFQSYLDYFDIGWFDITAADIDTYCDSMAETVSPVTMMEYAENTVKRRENTIRHFYASAHSRGDVSDPRFAMNYRPSGAAIKNRALAHTGSQRLRLDVSPTRASGRKKAPPNPMTRKYWKRVSAFLGPLTQISGARSVVHRLACETSIQTALRIEELCWLTKGQILSQTWPPDWPPKRHVVIDIKVAKGISKGAILAPIWLIQLLVKYIEDQREKDVQAGIANGNIRYDEGFLFVNSDGRPEHRGKRLKPDTLRKHFSTAVAQAGYVSHVVRSVPGTGETQTFVETKYNFHDLRHTYAIWKYYSLILEGHSAPWVPISKQLRHASHLTTEKFYLTASHEFEALVSDHYMARRR